MKTKAVATRTTSFLSMKIRQIEGRSTLLS